MMLYSPSALGFFVPGIHAQIPEDALPVDREAYDALMDGQANGMQIVPGAGGMPALAAPPVQTEAEILAAERARMVCSRFQARAALHIAGLLPQVEAAVAAADPLVQIAWADATEFRRNSPTIAALASSLSLTDAQIDDLFRSAAQITA